MKSPTLNIALNSSGVSGPKFERQLGQVILHPVSIDKFDARERRSSNLLIRRQHVARRNRTGILAWDGMALAGGHNRKAQKSEKMEKMIFF